MALMTTLVLCARSQDLVMSMRRVRVVLSTLLDLRAEKSRVVRHVKPPCCGEASRKPCARSGVRTQAIDALAQSFNPLSYPSALNHVVLVALLRGRGKYTGVINNAISHFRQLAMHKLVYYASFRGISEEPSFGWCTICQGGQCKIVSFTAK